MSGLNGILERFDNGAGGGGVDLHTEQIKTAAFTEGFAAGEAAAKAKQEAEKAFYDAATQQFRAALGELPSQLSEQMCEAMAAVLRKVLPSLSEKGFADETAAAIVKHFDFSNPGSFVIKVSEERLPALKDAFATLGDDIPIAFSAEKEFTGSMVSASWQCAGIDMDIDAAAQAALGCLETYSNQFKKEKQQ